MRLLLRLLTFPFRLIRFLLGAYIHLHLNPNENIIVITGCDSGFGLMTALALTEKGYLVIATCLTHAGVENIGDRVYSAIQCDVTSTEDVNNLSNKVKNILKENPKVRLWALVNNAGVAPMGYIDWLSMSSVRKAMEVNYFAVVSVTKALLPLFKLTRRSRIINISSAAGYGGFPHGGAYCASKHAIEGYSKCLRQELGPWGIEVCNVNPGFMKTPLIESSFSAGVKEFEMGPKEITSQYPLTNISRLADNIRLLQEDPKHVVNQILHLITIEKPLLVNAVGYGSHIVRWLQWLFPQQMSLFGEQEMAIFNESGPYPSVVRELQASRE